MKTRLCSSNSPGLTARPFFGEPGSASRSWNRLCLWPVILGMLLIAALFTNVGSVPAMAQIMGQVGEYHVGLLTNPPVIPVGKFHVILQLSNASGKPVANAQVQLLVQMPSMPMGEKDTTAVPEPGKPGSYSTDAACGMAGSYAATLHIQGPQGTATGTLTLSTGQNTSGSGGGVSVPLALAVLAILIFLAFVIYRMRRTGQKIDPKVIANPGVLGSIGLVILMLFVANYAVNHWRRPGAMTPIEAQAMQMSTPAPPGTAAATLAAVTRGPIQSTVRYTGQAVAYSEADVSARTQGWLTWMPFYVGDAVQAGEVVARLDTSQQNPLVAQQQAGVSMAVQGVDVSQREYQQALANVTQAQAEVQGKQDALAGSQADIDAARADESNASANLTAANSQISSMTAALQAAQADQQYWQEEMIRETSLFHKGAVSRDDFQKEQDEAANANAKVRQAESGVAQAQSQATAAAATVSKAQAAITSALRKAAQMASDVRASKAAVNSSEAAASVARQRILLSQAGVEQAQSALTSAATNRGYAQIVSQMDGLVARRIISPGALVNPGQAILTVAQISPIRLQANVAQSDLDHIRMGASVTVSNSDGTNQPVLAHVTSISPSVDPSARTALVEAIVPNQDSRFLPGQYVVMDIATGAVQNGLRAPTIAIHTMPIVSAGPISTGVSYYVVVADPIAGQQGQFTVHREQVQTGITDGVNTQILSGLKEGQLVVTTGADSLKDGDVVTNMSPVPTEAASTPTIQPTASPPVPTPTNPVNLRPVIPAPGKPSKHQVKPELASRPNTATVKVSVQGFTPDRVVLRAGVPATLTFIRTDNQTCATSITIPAYKITRSLPLNKPVVIPFTPHKGTFVFICGMGMLRGQGVAR